MSFSKNEYPGTGAQTDFAVSFPYIDQSHVTVTVDGVETAFTWVNDGLIRISPAPAVAAFIRIRRETSQDERLVNYVVPSSLNDEDLNNDSKQAFFMAQEAIDRATESMGQDDTGQWDAISKRIKNVADPTAATDGVNRQYAESLLTDGSGNPILTRLAASTGSSLIGHTASGIGAVSRDVQEALRASVRSGDYDTNAHYLAGLAALTETVGVKNLDVGGTGMTWGTAETGSASETNFRVLIPTVSGAGKFSISVGGAFFVDTQDDVLFIGYNHDNNGGKLDPDEAMLAFNIEADYNNGVTGHQMEWNMNVTTPDDSVDTRPFAFAIERDSHNFMYWSFRIGDNTGDSYFSITSRDGLTNRFLVDRNGDSHIYRNLTLERTSANPVIQAGNTNASINFWANGTGSFGFYTTSGTTRQFNIAHVESAVNYVQAEGAATTGQPVVSAQGGDTDVGLAFETKGGADFDFFSDAGSTRQFKIARVASAVNYLKVNGAATGVAPSLSAVGSDTNVDVQLVPQGTGTVKTSAAMRILIGTAIPAGGTAGAGFRFSSTANFGVFFGSGAPSLSAAKGSLYLRSDGSSTSTRLYVNTDGSTTWTNVTTAA